MSQGLLCLFFSLGIPGANRICVTCLDDLHLDRAGEFVFHILCALYIFTGDMDTYYLNNPVHKMQEFLESTSNPHVSGFFWYAPREVHCWTGPFTPLERLEFMAKHITRNAPESAKLDWWPQGKEDRQ